MKYNWLRDRLVQEQFSIQWDKGIRNMADYFTKYHSPTHHKLKRFDYIQPLTVILHSYIMTSVHTNEVLE